MKNKLSGLLTTAITVLGLTAQAQQIQPNPNPLYVHPPAVVPTVTVTPNAPYTNPQGGSSTPYTTGPLQQQTGPPPVAKPPADNPHDTMRKPMIVEPAHQPFPPPKNSVL